jgi:hypothetical protein
MLTVAEQLQRMGHETLVHAAELGPMAQLVRDRGVRVLGADELPAACELVLFQDAPTCLELAPRYESAARIFVAHSVFAGLQCPPQIAGACQAVVALNDRTLRWADALAQPVRLERLRQPVDLDRFRVSAAHRSGPLRAVVLSNYAFGTRTAALEEACRDAGVELRWIGSQHGSATPTPELELAAANIAIGLGRSVLDAMASCRPAIVLGTLGGDGWVTPESYATLEADGFTGRATDRVLDAAELTQELLRFTPELGISSRDLVARHHDVRDHVGELIRIARELEPEPVRSGGVELELARLVRVEWQRQISLITARAEGNRLARELQAAREAAAETATRAAAEQSRAEAEQSRADAAQTLADQAEARARAEQARSEELANTLTELVATRRWRFAVWLSRPLDRLRELRATVSARARR